MFFKAALVWLAAQRLGTLMAVAAVGGHYLQSDTGTAPQRKAGCCDRCDVDAPNFVV